MISLNHLKANNMTTQQTQILINFMRTLGYSVQFSGVENYDEHISRVKNNISNLEISLKDLKETKENFKNDLINAQSELSNMKKSSDSISDIMGHTLHAKRLQEEYNSCKKDFEEIRDSISKEKMLLESLLEELEQIKNLVIDFGKDVRNEHGNVCTMCGFNDAYEQVNPYVSELEGRTEIIVICDECSGKLADEI